MTMRIRTVGWLAGLLAAPMSPAAGQSQPPDVGPGRIAWFDLTTTRLAESREFYGRLFGWQFTALQGTDQALEIVAPGGGAIGTLRVAEGGISAFNGVVYVQVTDLPLVLDRARRLGGRVVPGFPFDLPGGLGAVAVLIEPGGHPIGLYSRPPLPGRG